MPGPRPDGTAVTRARLDAAYRRTVYRVTGRGDAAPGATVDLRIGRTDPALTDLLCREGGAGAAIVSACNPGSRRVPDPVNESAHRALERAVAAGGWAWLPALALDPLGDWPAEPGLLILGIERSAALRLARRFGQNALVRVEPGTAPQLIWVEDAQERGETDG